MRASSAPPVPSALPVTLASSVSPALPDSSIELPSNAPVDNPWLSHPYPNNHDTPKKESYDRIVIIIGKEGWSGSFSDGKMLLLSNWLFSRS